MPLSPERSFYLTNLAEGDSEEESELDFKEKFDPNKEYDWVELIRDIVAMANTNGGVIVFGCDSHGRWLGSGPGTVDSTDHSEAMNKIFSYTGENFDGVFFGHVTRDSQRARAWFVRKSRKVLVFKRDGSYEPGNPKKGGAAFRAGQVLVRHGSKSEFATAADLETIIEERVLERFEVIRGINNRAAPPMTNTTSGSSTPPENSVDSSPNRTT
jgi:predicted HTH transcriptional regulator